MPFKYVNLNSHSVLVPNKRGGMESIRAGDVRTDPWYGRFIGPHRLTSIEVASLNDDGIVDSVNNTVPVVSADAIKKITAATALVIDEDHPHYYKSNGIYVSKLGNGMYRTGSRELMHRYLADNFGVHYTEKGELNTPALTPEPTPMEVDSKPASGGTTSGMVSGIEEMAEQMQVTTAKAGFTCDKCGREFETAPALKSHTTRMHKVGE